MKDSVIACQHVQQCISKIDEIVYDEKQSRITKVGAIVTVRPNPLSLYSESSLAGIEGR